MKKVPATPRPPAEQPPAGRARATAAAADPAGGADKTRPCQPGEPFISVHDLRKRIGWQSILRGISIDILQGETLCLIGQSGEGKSVFLKHLLGLMKPDTGRIVIEGTDICALRERQLARIRRKVGILFQNGALFDSMTVAENVAFPLREEGVRDRKVLDARTHEALAVVGLARHKAKMPINLSGGMRKRVALARAIITRPECILYDEPTAGLDPIVADSIDKLINRLKSDFCVTSVVVTHDMKSVFAIADRVAYLREGRIFFLGTPDELRRSEDQRIQDFIAGRSSDEVPDLMPDDDGRASRGARDPGD